MRWSRFFGKGPGYWNKNAVFSLDKYPTIAKINEFVIDQNPFGYYGSGVEERPQCRHRD